MRVNPENFGPVTEPLGKAMPDTSVDLSLNNEGNEASDIKLIGIVDVFKIIHGRGQEKEPGRLANWFVSHKNVRVHWSFLAGCVAYWAPVRCWLGAVMAVILGNGWLNTCLDFIN